MLAADLAAEISDAEADLRALRDEGANRPGLARLLLFVEGLASCRIDGLAAPVRRLLRDEVALSRGRPPSGAVAAEILSAVAAIRTAVAREDRPGRVAVDDLLGVRSARTEAGVTAARGDGDSTPSEGVRALLADLGAYVGEDRHSPLVQAAVAHAQFEAIRTFAAGNGRTGRALVHLILRRRGTVHTLVPPLSLVLAGARRDYEAGLAAFRGSDAPGGLARSHAAHRWLWTFTAATRRACAGARSFADAALALEASWRDRLGRVRGDSAVERLLAVLPGTPVVTAESAAALIGRSEVVTGQAIRRLVERGVLSQRDPRRRRYRLFEAKQATALFVEVEQALAGSPPA